MAVPAAEGSSPAEGAPEPSGWDTTKTNETICSPTYDAYEAEREVSAWERHKPIAGLIFGLVLAVVTIYLHSSAKIEQAFYGEDGDQNPYLWYVVMVPCYTLTFIFGTRFVGSYVVGVWVKELVNSKFVHSSVLRLTENIVMDERMPDIVAHFITDKHMIKAASQMVAKVTKEQSVHDAASGMVANVLRTPEVLSATTTTVERVLEDPRMRDCTADLLRDKGLAKPLANQVARVLEEPLMVDAVTVFMQSILEDTSVRREIKQRAKSIAADPDLYSATRRGIYDATLGHNRHTRQSSSGGTSDTRHSRTDGTSDVRNSKSSAQDAI